MSSENYTLQQYQALIQQLVRDRGFDKETTHEVFTLLVEEVGEVAKALRRANGQKIDPESSQHELSDELADVFWLLLDLANRLEVDLAEAFIKKELKNAKRVWQ